MRAIVSVGTGKYQANGERLFSSPWIIETGHRVHWHTFPDSWPAHEQVPYGFKVYAIEEERRMTAAETILWCDSSIVPITRLNSLWQLIESQGYWFSANHHWTTGQWCSDAALPILGITREESFTIPHVCATAFGLDFRHQIARDFFSEWKRLAEAGAFNGPWRNDNGEVSPDPRVLGHRHDQTAASVVAWRLGMKLTTQPDYISDGAGENERTVLTVQRGT